MRGVTRRSPLAADGAKSNVTPSKTHLVLIPSYNPGSKALDKIGRAHV